MSQDQAHIVTETKNNEKGEKDFYLEGIMIQGGVKNANSRVYPVTEITSAVNQIMCQINEGYSVLGELDHPEDLKINVDRVSHVIQNMWIKENDGYGKLKILDTPKGLIVRTLLESGVKLGVSSRGSGNVQESTGNVSDFEIVTVDIVAHPSAPNAYPQTIYESIMNAPYGHRVMEMAEDTKYDRRVQRHLKDGMSRIIRELTI